MHNSSDERRKDPRIYRNFIMSYHEKGKSAKTHDVSQVNNVSKGGVNFSSTHPLKKEAILTVELKTPFISDSLILDGFVVDCREKIAGMIYEVRLKFQDIPSEALVVLEKIEKYSKNKES